MSVGERSDNPVCPYCENQFEGVLVREVDAVVMGDGAPTKEKVRILLCPGCRKVLGSGGNVQSIGNIEIMA